MDWVEMYTCLARDRESQPAWLALERRVRSWACAELSRLGPDAVDDVVAETCSKVALGFKKARGAATFAGFVYGHYLTVRRGAIQAQRRTTLPLEGVEIACPDPAERLDPETLARLWQALQTLPGRERTAVLMRYLENSSGVQIARVLGVSTGNARQIGFRGISRLRKYMRAAA